MSSVFTGMTIDLDVVKSRQSVHVGLDGGTPTAYRQLSLVLRPNPETRISLPSGKGIRAENIHLTLSTRWKKAADIEALLPEGDAIGFLVHDIKSDGSPGVISGSAIWPMESFPDLNGTARWGVTIGLSNLSVVPHYAPPFQWGAGTDHVLLIDRVKLHTLAYPGQPA